MNSQPAWGPAASSVETGEWPARPRYAPQDIPALLWRERRLMLAVFLGLFLAGVAVAVSLKRLYPAHSSVLVRLGQEYVYEPLAGDAARGAVPGAQQVLESERDILGSDALKRQVVNDVGFGRLHPDAAREFAAASPDKRRRLTDAAVAGIRQNLKIETAPDTPVIRLTYSDPNPTTAALTLNTLLDDYLVYRRQVLQDPTASALDQQKRSFQARLEDVDAAYQQFLSTHRIGDYEAEKTNLSQLQAQIDQQQYQTAAQLKERQGRLAGLDAAVAQTAPEAPLYRDADVTAQNKLLDLKIQREAALAKYQPNAQPVRDLDVQIAQLSGAIASGRAAGEGVQRTGANPVWQTLQTEKLQVLAEVDALRSSLAMLTEQSGQLTERRLRLAALEPTFEALTRERDVLQANVKDFSTKEEQSRASQEISAKTNDNIRIVERARPPSQGVSLRLPVLVLSFFFAIFSAVCAGLLRVFLRPGLGLPATAARTLELPVLAVAAMKA